MREDDPRHAAGLLCTRERTAGAARHRVRLEKRREREEFAAGMLSPLDGMFIPFAKTKADRMKTGDPRLSLEERYPTRADYLARLTEAAQKLCADGFLLAEDAHRIIERAKQD